MSNLSQLAASECDGSQFPHVFLGCWAFTGGQMTPSGIAAQFGNIEPQERIILLNLNDIPA